MNLYENVTWFFITWNLEKLKTAFSPHRYPSKSPKMSTVGSQTHSKRVETQLLSLLEKMDPENLKSKSQRQSMMVEVRTLDLWRAIIAECLATVFYVFLVCGSYSSWVGINVAQDAQARVLISMVSGLSMMVLVQSFSEVCTL